MSDTTVYINGVAVGDIRDVEYTPNMSMGERMMRAIAIQWQREAALDQWCRFNEVYGYGLPDGVKHWPDLTPANAAAISDPLRVKLLRLLTGQPKPSPRQYRLKRRAAGSKRRNKGVR